MIILWLIVVIGFFWAIFMTHNMGSASENGAIGGMAWVGWTGFTLLVIVIQVIRLIFF